MPDSERRYPARRQDEDTYDEEGTDLYAAEDLVPFELPEHRLRFALLAGGIAGLIMAAILTLAPLLDIGAFQRAAALGINMSQDTASTIASLTAGSLFLAVVVCILAGYIVGRSAVQRRLGFLTGLVAGAVCNVSVFIIRYISIYPGNTTPAPPLVSTYLLASLASILVLSCICGLISLIVAWLATRRHPYYDVEDSE